MGISDRDYARAPHRPPSGVGSVRVLSFNTWLIIINVVVFILNNVVLSQTLSPVRQEQAFLQGVTGQMQRDAAIDGGHASPQQDGTYIYPLVIQQQDRAGNTGPVIVGKQSVRYMPVLAAFGHFSTGKFWADGQVWRLLTFQFLHASLSHLVFNMLGLWFVGGLVEQYLGRRRYAVFYLTSGVFGALTYLLLNLLGFLSHLAKMGPYPFLLVDNPYTPLIGASAGVFGVMLAAAFIAPGAMVDVMLFFPMRLRTAVYIFLGLAVLNLVRGGPNAGGDAAHVGGALAGAYLIRQPHILRDILTGFGLFRSADPRPADAGPVRPSDRAAVETILEKISDTGLQSLSDSERATLRRAAGR